jgi:hypothetical protein
VHDEILTEAQQGAVEAAAEVLYGLIHARYVLTARGLAAMADKFKGCDFGRCPRVFCNSQPCLPVGLSDLPRQSTVKLFCPKCEDVFYPRSKYHGNLDGAYFGTTFPHLFLLTYAQLRPFKPAESYMPRVFGFRIHSSAYQREGPDVTAAATQAGGSKKAGKKKDKKEPDSGGVAPMAESSVPESEQQEGQRQNGGPGTGEGDSKGQRLGKKVGAGSKR